MKRIGRTFLKLFFYLSYPILIVALIVSLVLLVVKTQELNKVNDTFIQASTELNEENQSKQITIEDLKQEFTNLNDEVAALRSENADLKDSLSQLQLEGYGTISGKIFPVVTTSGTGFSQYQRVCAQSVDNTNIQTCRTVSAIQPTYTLSLPVGTYNVYAELHPQPAPDSPLSGTKTYYTQYVKCVQETNEGCDATKQNTPVVLEIGAGDTINNVDPIDWR
jgi:hypothetical protein